MLAFGLSETDVKILSEVWEAKEPIDMKEMTIQTKLDHQLVDESLQNLRKSGYIEISDGGYTITDEGKEALGFPKLRGQAAKRILERVPRETAFPFYTQPDKRLGLFSDSLMDFCEKLRKIDAKSIEFHTARGDFETWVLYLGDIELKERLRSIREADLSGEPLREKLYETVKSRCEELLKSVR